MSTSGPNGIAGLWPALDRALTQGQMGRMALQDAQHERAQKNSSLDALAALLPGITDSKGITWDQARPMDANEQKQTAMKAFPEQAAGALMSQLFPKPPSKDDFLGTPGEGGVYNWRTNTVVPGTHFDKPMKADLVTIKPPVGPSRSYNAATQQAEIDAAIKAGGIEVREPSTRVDVNMTPQTKALTELSSNALSEGRTNAMSGFESLYSLGRMKQALDEGLKPGALAPAQETVSNVLVGLGVDPNTVNQFYNATASADYDAASKELTRSVIKAFGPNPSNSDRDFAEKMAPQLKTNPQAAPLLIARIEAKHKGNIESYRSMLKNLQSDPNAGIALAELGAKQNQYDALLKDLGPGQPKAPGAAPTAPKPVANVIQSLPPDAVRQPDGTYVSASYPGKIIRPQ